MSLMDVNWNPPRAQLRSFGVIALFAFGALGGLVWWTHRIMFWSLGPEASATTAYSIWGLAAACIVLALTAPIALRPLYVGLMVIAYPIGLVVSYVMMAVLFYIVLTPVGLVFRLIGRDAMQRKIEPARASYWEPREKIADVKRYFRQF